MPAVANAHHTAAYKIFHYPFRIWIPQLYLTSIDENESLGTYTSGNDKVDREQARELIAITSKICDMVNFHKRGITIEFHSIADCVRIYETIVQHIEDFKEKISNMSYNRNDIPWQDLKDLDDFAGLVYLKARGQIANREQSSLALQSLESDCFALVRPQQMDPFNIFEEVATSTHKSGLEETRNSFEGRLKTWR